MEIQWSLLKLNPQSQGKYVQCIGEYCPQVEYYFPRYEKLVRPHGIARPVKVLRPVYPGYIFIRVGDVELNKLTSLPVRAYWVRFGGEIETVDNRVIERIKDFEGRGELVQEVIYVNPYRAGVRVYVHLPVADLLAVIVKMVGGTRAVVDLPVGRCTVPLHCLEAI